MKSLKLLFIGSVAQAGLICEHPKLTKIQNEIKEIFGNFYQFQLSENITFAAVFYIRFIVGFNGFSPTIFKRFQKSLKHKTDALNFGSRYYADENNYLREYNRNFTIKIGCTPSGPDLTHRLRHTIDSV